MPNPNTAPPKPDVTHTNEPPQRPQHQRRPPRQQRPVPQSLQTARTATQEISEKNPSANEIATKTLANVNRRITALERNPTITASNFGASDFDDLSALGLNIPANSMTSAAQLIQDVIQGRILHPKRFGAAGESLVMRTTSNSIIAIPDSGTGGFNTGDFISVIVPIHAAYKGAVIVSKNPTTDQWKVIGYAAPNRDPEKVSTACASLYSSLSISAPAAITGTTVAVTAQLMLELSRTHICPLSAIPGKVAAISDNGRCPILTIGPESHRIVNFTASDPSELVKRFTSYDAQNTQICYVPNAASLTADRSSAYPAPQQSFFISATATDSTNASGAGFADLSEYIGTGPTLVFTSDLQIFKLSTNCDALRHLLFGDFVLDIDFTLTTASGTAILQVFVDLQNGDGTVQQVLFEANLAQGLNHYHLNTRGAGQMASVRGLIISDIGIIITPGTSSTIQIGPNYFPSISLEFLDVPARTSYLSAVISGVQSGYRISVNLETHTEALLDPVAENSTFLEATPDLPYLDLYLPNLIRAHFLQPPDVGNFAASSFLDTARKILRVGGKVGRVAAPIVQQAMQKKFVAAGFGSGSKPHNSRVRGNWCFPAVQTNSGNYAIVPIIQNSRITDRMIDTILKVNVGYPVQNIQGRSGTLALLLAALSHLGVPVTSGLFSGEIIQLSPSWQQRKLVELTFVLAPVDEFDLKQAAASEQEYPLIGYFSDGWHSPFSSDRTFNPRDLFAPPTVVTFQNCSSSSSTYPISPITIRVTM